MKNPTVVSTCSSVRQPDGAPGSSRGERGIALVVVLLLMAVLSGLATGFAMNGNIEVQMGTNEVYYAGARAAAEAGLNRAIVEIVAITDPDTNFLAGPDLAWDAANAAATVNNDNGSLAFAIGAAGPYALDANGEYTYEIEILDDDNDSLYATPLTTGVGGQVETMGEDGSIYTNANDRLILRAIGYGPKGTIVRLARVLTTELYTAPSSNPALLVNGDLELNGGITIEGIDAASAEFGTVHANGNLSKTGASGTVTGSATASGTYSTAGGFVPGGESGGGRPTITVPDIHASDYEALANYKLSSTGTIQTRVAGVWTPCVTPTCLGLGWTFSGGTWNADSTPDDAILYVEGNVDIGTTSGATVREVSIFATGDINVHGNAKLAPNDDADAIQFVCDGDLKIDNGSDLDPPSFNDGQILVRGQIDLGGSMEFQGRIVVQDVAGAGSLVDDNVVHGTVSLSYGGSLDEFVPAPQLTCNVSGWMEQ